MSLTVLRRDAAFSSPTDRSGRRGNSRSCATAGCIYRDEISSCVCRFAKFETTNFRLRATCVCNSEGKVMRSHVGRAAARSLRFSGVGVETSTHRRRRKCTRRMHKSSNLRLSMSTARASPIILLTRRVQSLQRRTRQTDACIRARRWPA